MKNNTRHPVSVLSERLAAVLSVLLLCGAAAESWQFRPPPDATGYFNHVKAAADALPLMTGDWIGTTTPVSQGAIDMLHPNVIISRDYRNTATGATVGFLFVECQDARDELGHFPPVCYPAQGWLLQSTASKDWQVGDTTLHGKEYTLSQGEFLNNQTQIVSDFFLMPGIGSEPDMNAVQSAAGDLQRRFYGVAQVQFIFPVEFSEAQRSQAISELIGPMQNLMQSVLTIPKPTSSSAHGL
jgi:Protein of unknown function (DUF3485)